MRLYLEKVHRGTTRVRFNKKIIGPIINVIVSGTITNVIRAMELVIELVTHRTMLEPLLLLVFLAL